MSTLVRPRGGAELQPLPLAGEGRVPEATRAAAVPEPCMGLCERGDIAMLGIGGSAPLAVCMSDADRQGVCDGMRLVNGLFWPIRITLSADEAMAASFASGSPCPHGDAGWLKLSGTPMHKRPTADPAAPAAQVEPKFSRSRASATGAGKRQTHLISAPPRPTSTGTITDPETEHAQLCDCRKV